MQERYRKYLLVLLMTILCCSYLDRMVFGMALQSIKNELHLTDAQLGIVTGTTFALFFAVMGIPIARWVDRGNRIAVVVVTTAFWSVSVMLCGSVTSFAQLLLVRMGAAIGEAGCNPPAHSLIPDYYSRSERPRAVAVYMLGMPLGDMGGYVAGGWLNQLLGWRTTFLVIAVPGLVLAALAAFTLREPRRTQQAGEVEIRTGEAGGQSPTVRDVLMVLMCNATLRNLIMCFLTWYFTGWALVQWLPTFFIRTHGVESGELGTWLALVCGGGGLFGTWIGGELSYRYARKNERLQLVGVAALFVLASLFVSGALLGSSKYLAFGLLAVHALATCLICGPLFATIQTLVAPRIRATALALVSSFPIVVGMGLGPWTVGVMSDSFRPMLEEQALRYALLAVCPGYVWAAWHSWRASRTVAREIGEEQGRRFEAEDMASPQSANLQSARWE